MPQALYPPHDITADKVATARAQLAQAQAALPALISLDPDTRKGLVHLGPRSVQFAMQTLRVLEQNPQIVPPSLDVAGGVADRTAYELLQPLREEVHRFLTLLDDTIDAIGSDLMVLTTDGYAHLKLSGNAHGLEGLTKELSARWVKPRTKSEKPAG